MNRIDLTPLYRSSVGFDRFESLLDAASQTEKKSAGYPPYNIEALEDDNYAITVAVAGFTQDELDMQVEKGVLTITGKKDPAETKGAPDDPVDGADGCSLVITVSVPDPYFGHAALADDSPTHVGCDFRPETTIPELTVVRLARVFGAEFFGWCYGRYLCRTG